MNLSSTQKHELRNRGWSTLRQKAERPADLPSTAVLRVGEDVTFTGEGGERRLTRLENNR